MTMSRGPAPHTGSDPLAGGTVPSPDQQTERLLAALGGSWKWLLASAVATLVPGAVALAWPDATLYVLAVIIGLYLLVTGAFRFVASLERAHGDRYLELLAAVLFVLAGVLCLRHPLQTVAALSLIVGAVWVVTGMLTAWTALALKGVPHRGVVLGAAGLGIVAGVVVLALPGESAVVLTRLLGLWLVLLGLAELGVAFAWRAALRRALPEPPPPGPPAAA
ncbi:HdeD family acid-resistance protein [Streptomyces sp. NPDC056628]|uniref:HdeD family acid-resistance protein n=1 Tax=Streptomyces sp. NPDC056628 TaxID=3345882 RepID=UPI003690206F